MAKAKFHKAQRVFVKPVGTWAYVESVVPKWIRGCDEPIWLCPRGSLRAEGPKGMIVDL